MVILSRNMESFVVFVIPKTDRINPLTLKTTTVFRGTATTKINGCNKLSKYRLFVHKYLHSPWNLNWNEKENLLDFGVCIQSCPSARPSIQLYAALRLCLCRNNAIVVIAVANIVAVTFSYLNLNFKFQVVSLEKCNTLMLI